MHVDMMRQLAADRVEELAAGSRRARHLRVHRAGLATKADQAPAKREWRGVPQELFAR